MMDKNYSWIKKVNWYRQGGAIYLFYVFGPFFCINETIGYDKNILWQEGDVNTAFFGSAEEAAKTRWIIAQQRKDKNFIVNWIKDWDLKMQKLLDFCVLSFDESVEKWSDKKLIKFLRQYNKLALAHWKKGVLCEWTDPDGAAILRETINSFGINLSDDEMAVLIAPEKLTFVQKEFLERVKLARLTIGGKNIDKMVIAHAGKYHWYKNNWAYVHNFNTEYFAKLIKDDAKYIKKREREAIAIKTNLVKAKLLKRQLLKQKNIPAELARVLFMFSCITDWRDERKQKAVCISNYYLHKILKHLAQVNDLPEDVAGALCWPEVISWKIQNKTKKLLTQRRAGGIYICDKIKNCRWIYGRLAKNIFNTLMNTLNKGELRGQSACRGKAVGMVKIVETKNDFAKMRPGDILVATMTRPEYVSLMKIAGAIVTNEGGLTCHAAVVSRELGVPCVIGTQTASEVLKDGDKVEVDANNGIIRKLP